MIRTNIMQRKHVDAASRLLYKEWYPSLKEAKQRLELKLKNKEGLVALEKDKLVGVLLYARDYSHYANYAEDLAVLKSHRRKGIAKALLERYIGISKAETYKKQNLALSSTDVTNKVSIMLHKKAGFRPIGVLKGLHFGKDEIFFAYKLR